MTKLRHRRLPRRLGVGLALVVAIAAVIAIVLAVDSPSTPNASASSQPSGATAVQRRNLVETDTESGTLSYARPQTVYNRLSGTITWLPAVGQVIKQGQALYRVSGQPVVLMTGTTPAYRDLSAADSAGPDILQLNRDLVALGFNPDGIAAEDVWQPATTAAVEVFQESLGEAPTGVLTLGQIVFLPGQQVVSALQATLGSTGGGSGSPSGSAASYTTPNNSSAEFVSLNKTPATGQTGPTGPSGSRSGAGSPQSLAALVALLRAETAQLKAEMRELKGQQGGTHPGVGSKPGGNGNGNRGNSGKGGGSAGSGKTGGGSAAGAPSSSGASGNGSGSGGGSGGGNASPILQTSSTQLVATVDLDASKQSEAKVGEKVTVELPAGNTVNGTITAVSSVAQSSSGSGSGGNGNGNGSGSGSGNGSGNGNGSSTATIPVTIALSGHLNGAGLDQAAVSVNFAQAKANNVLSVPVTALLATSGGGYAVQEAVAPRKLIPVTTGLFAAGYVQISGPGIYPGLQVTDSQG